jgi:mono/diheme cytochrome c family protein
LIWIKTAARALCFYLKQGAGCGVKGESGRIKMKPTKIMAALCGAALICTMGAAYAQERKFDFGKREYDSNCASCHGLKGKGDGPYKPFLTKSPTDLTTLSKRNAGVYPFHSVYAIIDGRQDVAAHGPRDMPVWGAQYSGRAAEQYMDVPYSSEAYVRTRVLALTEYISRLQAK